MVHHKLLDQLKDAQTHLTHTTRVLSTVEKDMERMQSLLHQK